MMITIKQRFLLLKWVTYSLVNLMEAMEALTRYIAHICIHLQNFVYGDFCFQSKWNNRDQIYPNDKNNRKTQSIYRTTVLRHWILGNKGYCFLSLIVHERQETNEVSPMIAPVCYLEKISRYRAERDNSGRASLIP